MSAPVAQHTDERRIGACVYLLHMLLQRAEQLQPGLLDALIRGVAADRDSAQAQGLTDLRDTGVFDEALRMLELANDQLKPQP
ncbi:hypothetical protein N6G02_22410 [Cupriavidus gilardii]|uniref:Uncharacterized protein n=1 Tax=Cupriavidus gilardii TaxID=82541 RepID=A0A6N1BFR6_9BURK|nr:hypothetical protein [Cupriavidus gilardii]ALD90665.1 hypothetical protein CR3_1433 [Cupriavidus gilardii CR3]KAB0597921.1 hypothetical protein F7Q96_08440 [Cupriavidus gilardii]MCT9015530.1 hypothetical protein [Cupriavidus gilardii]MCT9055300.1 hypothetical protein [Cupriavidus gilardii]MCT9071861.1 hypothetical protein [Cupriavidus gilardii]